MQVGYFSPDKRQHVNHMKLNQNKSTTIELWFGKVLLFHLTHCDADLLFEAYGKVSD